MRNARKGGGHLGVVGVVAGQGNAMAPGGGHSGGTAVDGAVQGRVAHAVLAVLGAAAGDVHGHAGSAQGLGNALAHATAGTGNDGDAAGVGAGAAQEWGCGVHGRIVRSTRRPSIVCLDDARAQGGACA